MSLDIVKKTAIINIFAVFLCFLSFYFLNSFVKLLVVIVTNNPTLLALLCLPYRGYAASVFSRHLSYIELTKIQCKDGWQSCPLLECLMEFGS
jgi:hypothetical protein